MSCDIFMNNRERSRQKNFQLVLITHDLRFVELIGRSGVVDKFSSVKKSPGLVLLCVLHINLIFTIYIHRSFSSVLKTPISELPTYN